MSAKRLSKAAILLGHCVPSLKANASKIRIRKMELDTNLNMVRLIELCDRFPTRLIVSLKFTVFQKGFVRVCARSESIVQSGRHRAG